jgi:hypothetical protein
MDQKVADACVYPALSLATTLYAVILDHNKRYAPPEKEFEPYRTVDEVIIGSAICLAAGTIRAAPGPDDRRTALRATALAFIVGSIPIYIWQRMLHHERARQARDTLQQHNREQNGLIERSPRPARVGARTSASGRSGDRQTPSLAWRVR